MNEMESDDHDHHQPTPTSEKHVITTSDGDEQGPSQVTPRSYECNFCKRGFSNAQALGGHMNIHRKDKAKLKQQSQQQPLDIHHHNKVPPILEGKSNKEPTNNDPNGPYWNVSQISREESLVVHMRQLPLFAESPPDAQTLPEGQRGNFSSGHHGSSSSELDLELRLGPEPHDHSSSTGTRKFL